MAALELEQFIGVRTEADGHTDGPLRIGRQGALIVGDTHGHFYESTRVGQTYSLCLPLTATGISAGNLVAAAAAAAVQFALWNPVGSGKNISLLKFGMGIVSGTWPAGPLFHGIYLTAPTITSTTAVPAYNNLLNGAAPAGRYIATAAQTGTATTGASAAVTFRIADFSSTSTAQATVGAVKAIDFLDGDIVLPPGTGWVPLWSGTGTSVLNAYSITWEEIPV